MKKTTAAVAIAALALPAAAQAHKPDNAGTQNADSKRAAHQHGGKGKSQKAKSNKGKSKTQRVGFTAKGTELALTDQNAADGLTLGEGFTLDLFSANKHAREYLKLTKEQIAADQAVPFSPATDDTFTLKFEGVTDGADEGTDVGLADVVATDRVKVIGKVERTRTKSGKGKPSFSYGENSLDIRKVIITRGEVEQD